MAYFANGSEGECFHRQCDKCKYGNMACPIALVQMTYNYDACGNKVASDILSDLVGDDGTCRMYEMARKDFTRGEDGQLSLF